MSPPHRTVDLSILNAVDAGLSSNPKTLPSWLMYDEEGNAIFQAIMHLPEYYPSRCEYEILSHYKDLLLNYFEADDDGFNMVELGAGDGTKTEVLLEYFLKQTVNLIYHPADVSPQILDELKNRLHRHLPQLKVEPIIGEHEQVLKKIKSRNRKVILFLGSSIGNYTREEAIQLLQKLHAHMNEKDFMLIGFDLKKDPRMIALAYDDPKGVTSAFNLNMLKRINRELGGNFDITNFLHFPLYNPLTGAATSYLISTVKQQVYVEALQKTYSFNKWDTIRTEISQKYDMSMIEEMLGKSGFKIVEIIYDEKKFFCDVLVQKSVTSSPGHNP